MKSKLYWLVASAISVAVFFSEFGCLFYTDDQNTIKASQTQADNENIGQKIKPIITFTGNNLLNISENHPISVKFPIVPKKEINAILITSCEREPDEIAVPLNVGKNKSCHKVTAEAIYAGPKGIIYLEADFVWDIQDPSIVRIIDQKQDSKKSFIELEASRDIFSSAGLTAEPETQLSICVTPKNGWQDPNHIPLCRSLPVYAVANMEGSWCFTGKEFTSDPGVDCETISISQDGRFLSLNSRGSGVIYEKQMDFYIDNMGYRTIENTGIQIEGIVLAGEDVEGTFSAFRLPL